MGRLAILVTLSLALAGCLDAARVDPAAAGALVVDGVASDVARWNGTLAGGPLTGAMQASDYACWTKVRCETTLAACEGATCERRPFEVAEPAGGALVLSVRWPSAADPKLDAWIEDADGAIVAVAPREYVGYHGLVARLDDAQAGSYVAVVAARSGDTSYEAALRVEPSAPDAGRRELLPNLVTLPPTDLLLDTPQYAGASYFAFQVPGAREISEATGSKGCRLDEIAEYRAARCLRFSNAVANVGEGPLDVRLAPGSLAFTQLVHWSDGTTEPHPGGAAEWHATHAHWHNAASNQFTIRTYDPATGEMGEPLGEGRKGGICFADTGITDVGLPTMWPALYTGWECFDPVASEAPEWSMGISPGWYDLYPYVLSDQYVDISAVEDGTYALCSVTNAEGTLAESDTSDNEACTPFRLEGDAIELLGPEPYHAIPAKDRI